MTRDEENLRIAVFAHEQLLQKLFECLSDEQKRQIKDDFERDLLKHHPAGLAGEQLDDIPDAGNRVIELLRRFVGSH